VRTVAKACPNADQHTPSPVGYLQWHAWAEEKARTHSQMRCDGCGRYAIWVPKTATEGGEDQ
jgi:hypothetical protein